MKLTIATLLALPFFAAASPFEARQAAGSCSTGSMQCCEQTVPTNSTSTSNLLGSILGSLLGVPLGDITGLLGLDCTPLNGVAVDGGNDCTSNPVCCNNTQQGGLIGIGCAPIDL